MIALFDFLRYKKGIPLISCTVVIAVFLITVSVSEAKEYYKWKDDKGNTHVTDDIEKVPDKYIKGIETYNKEKQINDFNYISGYMQYLNVNKLTVAIIAGLLIASVAVYLLFINAGEMLRLSYDRHKIRKREKLYSQSGIKNMGMEELQQIIKEHYKWLGYSIIENETLLTSVSFIAQKGNERIVVNINDNLNPLSRKFISELDSEKHRLGCSRSAVFTKSWLDDGVTEFAKSINCSAYDRYDMASLFRDYSKFHSQNH